MVADQRLPKNRIFTTFQSSNYEYWLLLTSTIFSVFTKREQSCFSDFQCGPASFGEFKKSDCVNWGNCHYAPKNYDFFCALIASF